MVYLQPSYPCQLTKVVDSTMYLTDLAHDPPPIRTGHPDLQRNQKSPEAAGREAYHEIVTNMKGNESGPVVSSSELEGAWMEGIAEITGRS